MFLLVVSMEQMNERTTKKGQGRDFRTGYNRKNGSQPKNNKETIAILKGNKFIFDHYSITSEPFRTNCW